MAGQLLSLTPEIQAWMHDVLVWGGKLKASAIVRPQNYGQMYEFGSADGEAAAKDICEEITTRNFDIHQKVDHALDVISKYYFNPDINSNSSKKEDCIRISASTAAEYIAVFCKAMNIVWNDKSRSNEEIKLFKASKLGAQLWRYQCFVSQIGGGVRVTTTTGGTRPKSTGSSTGPTNDYKASGPQSGNARGLVGNPHEKINPKGEWGKMFDVEYDKKGVNVPYLFVDPLGSKGDAGNNVNKVLEGSGNGYTDCACYFNTREEADEFKKRYAELHNLKPRQLPNDQGIVYDSGKFSGLHVGKGNLQPNGYFMVNTECGKCYIRANKLNEDMDLDEELEVEEMLPESKLISEMTTEEFEALKAKKKKAFEEMQGFFNDYVKYDLHK